MLLPGDSEPSCATFATMLRPLILPAPRIADHPWEMAGEVPPAAWRGSRCRLDDGEGTSHHGCPLL
nr:unnamed protein product [Digitaria exilis]